MNKNQLIDELSMLLLRHGYALKQVPGSCFDIIARGPKSTLLLCVLKDANALSPHGAAEMRRIAGMVDAVPLLISESAGKKLEDGVVYMRAQVYTLTLETFRDALRGEHPMLMSSTAGVTFSLSGEKLRSRREERGFSRKDLSRRLGVSPKMVDRYESDSSAITFTRGLRIYDLFGEDVFDPVNLFDFSIQQLQSGNPEQSDISVKYSDLGFDVADFKKVPFDLIARSDREIIFTDVSEEPNPEMQSLARLVDAENLLIFEKKKPKDKDIPVLKKDEFLELKKAKELLKFLKEF